MNAASNVLESLMRKDDSQVDVQTDVSNPANDPERFADPSGEKMRALTWHGHYDVRVVDSLKPKIINDQDVILQVTGTSICGSDLHPYRGAVIQMKQGDIMGHEIVGKVEFVGPTITKFKPGDRVVASFQIACGDCYYCKQKLTSMCERTNANELHNYLYGHRTAGTIGFSHLNGGYAGGQAEYVRIPYANTTLLKLPDNVPDEKGQSTCDSILAQLSDVSPALYLSDVLCTAYHGVVETGVQTGDTVAIWGMGPIGFMAAFYCFQKGASRVIAIDNNWRLQFAQSKLPKLELLDYSKLPSGSSVPTELRKMADKGVDRAIDCVGGEWAKGLVHKVEIFVGMESDTSETINECIMSVKKFGTVGIVGVYAAYTNHLNIGAVMELGIRLVGVGQAPVAKYWEELLKQIGTGELDPTMMITHRIDLEDVPKGYKIFNDRSDNMMKVYVQTRFSSPPAKGTPALTKF